MMRVFCTIFFFICLATALQGETSVVAAYFDRESPSRNPLNGRPVFSLSMLPPDLLTDLYYAFIPFKPSPQGWLITFTDADRVFFKQMRELKGASKALNLFASFGGWEFNSPDSPSGSVSYQRFNKMVSTPLSRAQFIDAILAFLDESSFDGIDLDWEYPADLLRGGEEKDLENFISLLKELRARFQGTKYLISAAFPGSVPHGLPASFHENPDLFFKWIASCSNHLDRVNLMAYDYHGPFDNPKLTGVNAPLNLAAKSVENYMKNGVPKEKIVLGIPLFGHIYSGVTGLSENDFYPGKPFQKGASLNLSTKSPGLLAYYEIADLITNKTFSFGQHPESQTAIGYSPKREEWISFDTPETIRIKGKFAAQMGLKGIFFWSLDMDEYKWNPSFPNISAGKKGLLE